jgi:hypothetical protein
MEISGTNSAGTKTSGTEISSTNSAGTKTSGTEISSTKTSGTETSGMVIFSTAKGAHHIEVNRSPVMSAPPAYSELGPSLNLRLQRVSAAFARLAFRRSFYSRAFFAATR